MPKYRVLLVNSNTSNLTLAHPDTGTNIKMSSTNPYFDCNILSGDLKRLKIKGIIKIENLSEPVPSEPKVISDTVKVTEPVVDVPSEPEVETKTVEQQFSDRANKKKAKPARQIRQSAKQKPQAKPDDDDVLS